MGHADLEGESEAKDVMWSALSQIVVWPLDGPRVKDLGGLCNPSRLVSVTS